MAGKKEKRLTGLLVDLGGDKIVDAAGDPISRDEALAKVLWDLALGYTYKDGETERFVAPDRDIAKFIFERREGRVPTAAADDRGVMNAAEKVSDLARNRINSRTDDALEADATDAVPKRRGSMGMPTLGPTYSEGPDA